MAASPAQLSRTGVTIGAGTQDVGALQEDWRRHHYVVLPAFLDAPLLEFVRAHVDAGLFVAREHPSSGRESCMEENAAVWLLDFLMNAPELLRFVESITGVNGLGWFDGRIYRLTPGTNEEHQWHDDFTHGRKLGVSVNIGDKPFEGGLLGLRDYESHAILASVANTGRGDCVIFRLGNDIEHQVLPVTGDTPRVAYAGWFREGDTHAQRIKDAGVRPR
jgi:hypothetical protein